MNNLGMVFDEKKENERLEQAKQGVIDSTNLLTEAKSRLLSNENAMKKLKDEFVKLGISDPTPENIEAELKRLTDEYEKELSDLENKIPKNIIDAAKKSLSKI